MRPSNSNICTRQSQIDRVLANAIALVALSTPLTLWNTIVGIIILCILQAYAPAPGSSRRLNLAYAATWSISFLATLGIVFNMIFRLFGGSFPDTDPTIPFTPFPEYKPNTFTPFNAYDVSFFLVWLAIFPRDTQRVSQKGEKALKN